MIGRLSGTLLIKKPPQLLIDVNGVGYEVEAPMSTFYTLPQLGEPCVLLTHLVVRDDAHLLFGFASERERELFRALIKVSGVGAKVALAILSGISADDFVLSVTAGDVAMLTSVPGIGKKTAERLVVEMRDKLDTLQTTLAPGAAAPLSADGTPDASAEALAALVALGYKSADAAKMVKAVAEPDASTEQIIRLALQSTQR
ncbi:MAG: Holliday junction branch migration protein RuvA [Pseudomonadota bacterium]